MKRLILTPTILIVTLTLSSASHAQDQRTRCNSNFPALFSRGNRRVPRRFLCRQEKESF